MVWSICIFAHNEERLLPRCLAALDGAAAGGDYVVHVMENGSTDETARAARAIAAADPRIHVHEIAVGDKSNAWNEYVHNVAGGADMHIFIDGDIQPSKGAFKSLALALKTSPQAYAAAALPMTGRSRKSWATRLFTERYLSGNLYALSAPALSVFREKNIRLPTASVGEDGLLSYIFVTDFKGGPDDTHRNRVAVAAGAYFEFDSLQPNFRDLAIYRRRLKRYSKRYFQNEILYALLKAKSLSALPEHISEIYTAENVARLAPRWQLQNYFVDRETLKGLRALTAAR